MSIDPAELVNLDVTIAEFVAPRLRAYRAQTESFPADLESLEAWHAELDRMIRAWELAANATEDGNAENYADGRDGLALFIKRLGDLWL